MAIIQYTKPTVISAASINTLDYYFSQVLSIISFCCKDINYTFYTELLLFISFGKPLITKGALIL